MRARSVASGLLSNALEPLGARTVRVLSGPNAGVRMRLRLSHEKAYWLGVYERETQAALLAAAPVGGVAWDIGAHIGFFSLLLSRRCCVVAVEPTADTAARLRANVALNDARVEVVEAGVSGGGPSRLLRHPTESAMNRMDARGGPVATVTLDELEQRFGRPDIVKLDIEGAEVDALAAAVHLLASKPTLVIELHGVASRDKVLATLESAGYSVRAISPWRVVALA